MNPASAQKFASDWQRLMGEIETLEKRLAIARGERARLQDKRNEAIMALRNKFTTRELAMMFGITMGTVSGAINKELTRLGMGVPKEDTRLRRGPET